MTATRPTPEELRAFYTLPDDDEELLAECDVSAFRSSGPGGQHKNTTLTSVRLHHRPSGVVTIGRRERSQRRNLKDALGRLREKLARLLAEPKPRKKTRPPPAAAEKRLAEKHRRSRIKKSRSAEDWE